MPFRRILVPYDDSLPSKEALEKAIELIKVTGGTRLFMLNVVSELIVPSLFDRPVRTKTGKPMILSEYLKVVYGELKVHAKKNLEDVAEKYEEESGIKIETQVLIGKPAPAIVKFAKEKNIDLIIMGSRETSSKADGSRKKGGGKRRKFVRRLLPINLRSVSRSVSESAPCPILLIRP